MKICESNEIGKRMQERSERERERKREYKLATKRNKNDQNVYLITLCLGWQFAEEMSAVLNKPQLILLVFVVVAVAFIDFGTSSMNSKHYRQSRSF